MPIGAASISQHVSQIERLGARFALHQNNLRQQFEDVLHCILKLPEYLNDKETMSFEVFWKKYTGRCDQVYDIDQFQSLILYTSALPLTSVDVERAFSLFFHSKTQRRSSLKDTTMNGLLFIKLKNFLTSFVVNSKLKKFVNFYF